MLAAGIPEYRLPMEVLNREIKFLTDMGVEIRTSTPLGKGLTFDDIFAQGYKAIFVAIGAHKGRKLGIEGEELKGVLDGLSFLKEIKLGKRKSLKGKVVVIGGGNVAIDAARSAMRLGAGEVTIAYRRTREEMPASSEEIEQAENEGVKINYLAAPAKILGANGKVSEIEFTPMKLGPPDATERRATVPKKAPSFTTGVSTVIVAIGEEPDLSFLPEEHKFAIDRGNKFTIDTATLATSVPGVFAGGDAAGVPATVVDAMASGEKAAISIDRFIRGEPAPMPIFDEEPYYPEKRAPIPRAGEIPQGTAQIAMGMLPTEERITNFREVNMAFTEEEAVKEAQRCIRCDLELGTSELLFGK
jgi:NADPH-dependent glutamate synthase beta subunit-like oxidoreductase